MVVSAASYPRLCVNMPVCSDSAKSKKTCEQPETKLGGEKVDDWLQVLEMKPDLLFLPKPEPTPKPTPEPDHERSPKRFKSLRPELDPIDSVEYMNWLEAQIE